MKKIKFNVFAVLLVMIAAAFITSCTSGGNTSKLQAKVDSLENELKRFTEEKALTMMRLVRFDSLDFEMYNKQDWKKFNVSHADNIKVYYPDGTITEGLYPQHIDMLTPMFVFAPDTKIVSIR